MLKTTGLNIGYTKKPILKEAFSVEALPGQLIGIIGANGCGKSTLLKTLAGLIPALEGSIEIQGKDLSKVSPPQRTGLLSLILSNTALIPDIKVTDVVKMGRFAHKGWTGSLDKTDYELCEKAMADTSVTHLGANYFHSLSDGEKQRVLFAMSLSQNAPLMLFDEPASHLDVPARFEIYRLMKNLTQLFGKTVVFSTHDIAQAIQSCDIILAFHHGKIVSGAPEDLGMKGIYNHLFENKNIQFDVRKGDYIPDLSETHGSVDIQGKGDVYDWTVRALIRGGFQVGCNNNAPVCVIVKDLENIWEVRIANETFRVNSINELMMKIKTN